METTEQNPAFNCNEQIDKWINNITQEGSLTEDDGEELRSHLYDSMDELKKAGLDDEEAFLIAGKRLGNSGDWRDEFEKMNKGIIQMRRSVVILSGILAYFLVYYIVLFTSKLIFLISSYFANNEFLVSVNWVKRFIFSVYFLFILLFASIFFMEERVLSFFERLKFRPITVLIILFITVGFALADTFLVPFINKVIDSNLSIRDYLYDVFFYFRFFSPFLFCVSFVILYYRYFKKNQVV
jgi:hypothetical protein